MTEAYPLQWPDGWPRTRSDLREDSRLRFKSHRRYSGDGSEPAPARAVSFDVARKKLCEELDRLGASGVVISTNLPLRSDGLPRADATRYRIEDPGVAVYFTLKKRQMVMACDRYDAPSANLRSVGLAIEAMRQLERHGGGAMLERAFTGFAAIAPPSWKKPWREVFGVKPDWQGDIESLYREKAKHRHPDRGGSDALMAELNVAYEEGKRELKAA
jgi:hypothetical protein